MATDTTLEELVINDYTAEGAVIPETFPDDQLSLTPDTSLEKVVHDATLSGDGTADNPLTVVGGGAGGGLESVAHNTTLTGSGTSESPLGVSDSVALKTDIPDVSNFATKSEIPDTSNLLSAVAHDVTLTGGGTTEDPLTVANPIPDGGTEGMVLTKTVAGYGWMEAQGDSTVSKGDYCTKYGIAKKTGDFSYANGTLSIPAMTIVTPNGTGNVSAYNLSSVLQGDTLFVGAQGSSNVYFKVNLVYFQKETPTVTEGTSVMWWNGEKWQEWSYVSSDDGWMWRDSFSGMNSVTPVATVHPDGMVDSIGYDWTSGNNDIVAKQDPTKANGYTWYRKYSNGWVEQGGIKIGNSGNASIMTLPVPMRDNNYVAIATSFVNNVTSEPGYLAYIRYKATTEVTAKPANSPNTEINMSIYVCGMAA